MERQAWYRLASVLASIGIIGCGAMGGPEEEATSSISSALEGGNPNPGVLPIGSSAHGHSYGEWAAGFWQWALALPASGHPFVDPTCDETQVGPVFFSTDGDRTCHIGTGTTIFMTMGTWVAGSSVWDCEPTVPGVPCDEAVLRAAAKAAIDPDVIEAWIDDVPLNAPNGYRTATPAFAVALPPGSFLTQLGVAEGTYYPQVADGHWLMIAPFNKGEHTVRVDRNGGTGTVHFIVD